MIANFRGYALSVLSGIFVEAASFLNRTYIVSADMRLMINQTLTPDKAILMITAMMNRMKIYNAAPSRYSWPIRGKKKLKASPAQSFPGIFFFTNRVTHAGIAIVTKKTKNNITSPSGPTVTTH